MTEHVIETKNLTKQYGTFKALDDVSLTIESGSITGLIGPNGAGKTTLMKMLGGLVFPTSGEMSLFGESSIKGLEHSRSRMSFMIETPYAKEGMTARENLEKQRIQKGIPEKKRVEEVLELVKLSNTGKKKVKEFSLGMRQRLGIANALLAGPELMVLDEPINGLDPEGIVEIREMLLQLNREQKITILISSHILSELSLLCTDYVFINQGRLIERLTKEQLDRECCDYFRIRTLDNEKATAVLTNSLGIRKLEVGEDGAIHIFEGFERIPEISRALYEADAIPVELARNETNLEEYYMRKVQGGSIC